MRFRDNRTKANHNAKNLFLQIMTASSPLPTQRPDLLSRLAQPHRYDIAIVGGGATGLGVALDAAARGFSVVLVESDDFAKGTSSRSTKLVHGGVRYLAQGNISLVREALHERTTLLNNAPHLAQPLVLHHAVLQVLGNAFLWRRPQDVRRPRRQGWFRPY